METIEHKNVVNLSLKFMKDTNKKHSSREQFILAVRWLATFMSFWDVKNILSKYHSNLTLDLCSTQSYTLYKNSYTLYIFRNSKS